MRITSNPSGAEVRIDDQSVGETPATPQVKRSAHIVTFQKDGYEQAIRPVPRTVNGWVFGNILIGGLIGIIVDSSTGNAERAEETLNVDLRPAAAPITAPAVPEPAVFKPAPEVSALDSGISPPTPKVLAASLQSEPIGAPSSGSSPARQYAWVAESDCRKSVTLSQVASTAGQDGNQAIVTGRVAVVGGGPIRNVNVCSGGNCQPVSDQAIMSEGQEAIFSMNASGAKPAKLTVRCDVLQQQ